MSSLSPPDHRVTVATETPRLPQPLTAFVGRGRELDEAERLLAGSRLLTLSGAGGSGKTRLAIEVARRAATRFAHGVTWVDLAPLEDARLVPQQVAAALGIRDEGSGSAMDTLVGVLRSRAMLLVLDNCEHVVDVAAALAETLLRECDGLAILATSREPLAIPGERAWLVPPLTLPGAGVVASDAAQASEAMELFVLRARDVLPSFALTEANVGAVAEICRRLDGIPLAIELAAARVRALGPEQIARRLDDAFSLLTTGGRTALPRHRTLRATMEWSARLLSAPEAALLRRLGVFAGGFTLEAVETVCAGGEVAPDAVLDLLAQLVDRSLAVVRERETTARYHLLETVRQYALERLAEAGEEATLRAAHARQVAAEVTQWEPRLLTAERHAAMERLDVEIDNIRQALRWTHEHARAEHVRLAGALCWYWFSSRHWAEGRRWMEDALVLPAAGPPSAERGGLLFALGVLAALQGDTARALGVLRESVSLAVSRGDRRAEAWGNVMLGQAIAASGGADGKELSARAGEWFRATDELYGILVVELILGAYAIAAGALREAGAHAEEAVRIAVGFGLDREVAIARQSVAYVLFDAGEPARATRLAQASIESLQRDPSFLFLARGVELVAMGAAAQARWTESVTLFGAAAALRQTIGARLYRIDTDRYDPPLARARGALGETAYDAAWAAGTALPFEAALARALALPVQDAPGVESAPAAPAGPAPVEALHVRVLGPLEIHVEGRRLAAEAWRSARPRELFLYLLLHPEGRTREQIGLAFWPDASAAQLRNNFHVTLHHVRKAIGRADAVVIERERYRLNPALGTWSDATGFERQAKDVLRRGRAGEDVRAALGEALALYRGDLLEELTVGDWYLESHDHLKRLATDCALALAQAHLAAGDTAAAIPVLERLVRLDDLDEEAHRMLLEAYAATGARARAVQTYQDFAARLQRELDSEPETRTTALYQQLLRAGDA
jgi:predicted ATPase/DNA-binding SARP family transcriptional activator